MEERPGQERQGPRPGAERLGQRAERTTEDMFEWVADKVDWFLAPPFLPRETRQHLYAARREMMLAARSLLDRSIKRAEEAERRQEGGKATKIPVE